MSRDDRTPPPEDPRDDWIGESLREPQAEDELPPGFYARARERFEQESGSGGKRSRWFQPLPWVGTLAAAALLALIFLPQLHDSSGELARPESRLDSDSQSAPAPETPTAPRSDDAEFLDLDEAEAKPGVKAEVKGKIGAEGQDRGKAEKSLGSVVGELRQNQPAEQSSAAKKKLDGAADAAADAPATEVAGVDADPSLTKAGRANEESDAVGRLRQSKPEPTAAPPPPPARAEPERKRSAVLDRYQTEAFKESSEQAQLSGLRDATRSYHRAATPEAATATAWPGPAVPDELLIDWKPGSEVWWIPGEPGVRLVCRVEPEAQTDPGPLQVTVVRVPDAAGIVGPGCLVRLNLDGHTANIVYRDAAP